ncbi:MAG: CHASE domain-containing protein [Proteobacteria bacterium]|nr:CHASE domain-containing protein [Pseudomonadota bacterium]
MLADRSPRERVYPYIVPVVGLVSTLVVWLMLRGTDVRLLENQFRADAQRLDAVLQQQFHEATTALHDVASLLAIEPDLSQAEFRRFVVPLLERQPFLRAMSWNPRVAAGERASHERAAREAGLATYRISQRSTSGELVSARRQDEYVVVRLIEPLPGNEAALGYDVTSEPRRRRALERARDTGGASASESIVLVQAPERRDGTLVFLPVYGADAVAAGPQERQRSPRGYAVAVLTLGEIAEAAMANHGDGIRITLLSDLTGGMQPVYPHPDPTTAGEEVPSSLIVQSRFHWANRDWGLELRPTAAFFTTHERHGRWAALALGLLFTALMSAPVAALASRKRRLEREVRQRERAERALRASEERLSLVVSAAAEGTWDWNVETGEVYFSPSWKAALGYSEDQIPHRVEFWESIVHPDDMPGVREALWAHFRGDTAIYECENRLKRADGTWRWNLDRGRLVERAPDGKPLRMVGVDRDLTERKRAEAAQAKMEHRLRETQKLESLGVLAGGIAHDFNNLLTGILGNASELRESAADRETRDATAQIEDAAGMAADLCRQLLVYAGRAHVSLEPVDLTALLLDSLQLIETSIAKRARLELDLARKLPAVSGDPTQLRQVLMNLVINSAESFEGSSGAIHMRTGTTRPTPVDLEQSLVEADLVDVDCVYLEVEDDGCGMSEEVRTRLFEPFFTTKFTGRGLGLSATLGIVQSHGGALLLDTEPGRGTRIRVLIPATSRMPKDLEPIRATEGAPESTGLVLVVDDERVVREAALRMLKRLGYRTEAAPDGRTALSLLRELGSRVDCVILDLTMPGMDGVEVCRTIHERHPTLPVVLASGFDPGDVLNRFEDLRPRGVLRKPYRISDLRSAIGRALEPR